MKFAKCYKKSLSLTIQLGRLKARGKSVFASQQFTLVLCGVHGGITKKCQSRHDVEIDCIRRKSLARPTKYTDEERKEILRIKNKLYRENNPNKVKEWKEKNIKKIKDYNNDRYLKNKNVFLIRAKYYYRDNKDIILQKRTTKHPRKTKEERKAIYKEKQKLLTKLWKVKNRNKNNELMKKWRERNKDKVKIYQKKYIKNNPLVAKALRLRRRDRAFMVNESITKSLINFVYNKFNSQCFKCHSVKSLSIDHHYPLSKGFALTINNAVLLCNSCNCSKGVKLPETFYSPEQLTDLQLNYGISKSPLKEEQPSLFEARMPKNLERDNGLFGAMNAA